MRKFFTHLFCFSLLSCIPLQAHAKIIDVILDHEIQLSVNIDEDDKQSPLLCRKVTITNTGNIPIKNCFPFVNQRPPITIDDLVQLAAHEKEPLLFLYEMWNNAIVKDEECTDSVLDPLALIQCQGKCSSQEFSRQFVKLCHALGIETRLANLHGRKVYDFGFDNEWTFLDLENDQLYLGLDNQRAVSSEEVMDDPFLALRTKLHRRESSFNFPENWKQLAEFEIIHPTSYPTLPLESDLVRCERASGFDLNPGDTLHFETTENRLCEVHHALNMDKQTSSPPFIYRSFFPIQKVINHTNEPLILSDQEITLSPGEEFFVADKNLYTLHCECGSRVTGEIVIAGAICQWMSPLLVSGKNECYLGAKENQSIVQISYEYESGLHTKQPGPVILNEEHIFDHVSPSFSLQNCEKGEKIWWQIGFDSHFYKIPSNFDQILPCSSTISLSSIDETFLNPNCTYYFRAKTLVDGKWSEWSTPFAFTVLKPHAVFEVEFEQIKDQYYELSWERTAEDSDNTIEYLIFGSNSLDFVPSIYYGKQVSAIVDENVMEDDVNDNFIGITTAKKYVVNGGLAYYRIIAKKGVQLSVPSTLIHVYDQDLVQPRNVLQQVENDGRFLVKRILFPPSYPDTDISFPRIVHPSTIKTAVIPLLQAQAALQNFSHPRDFGYELPDVSDEIWEEVRPYLLPRNHPAWQKLNRIFCRSRATLNEDRFRKAGFTRYRPGRWSRVSASSHPECKEYFIKAYCDSEMGILYEWKKWIHRIKGAECIRKCIHDNHLDKDFKVPRKWIYPLPKDPSPPSSSHYYRKNFILVTENMRIEEHARNEKIYKTKVSRMQMKGLYIILQVCGLYDSVYVFNMPFCKDGKIAIIDTEYHHKWPIPFDKLTGKFPKHLQKYWKQLTFNGGTIPNGENQYNPPRMDRRDVPPKTLL